MMLWAEDESIRATISISEIKRIETEKKKIRMKDIKKKKTDDHVENTPASVPEVDPFVAVGRHFASRFKNDITFDENEIRDMLDYTEVDDVS